MLRPMLASLADAPLEDPAARLRTQVRRHPRDRRDRRRRARCGSGRASATRRPRQFPEIAAALANWARTRTQPLVLDGEIVALDAKGEPTGFQQLQGRIHLDRCRRSVAGRSRRPAPRAPPVPPAASRSSPSTSCATARPTCAIGRCVERRAALERVFGQTGSPLLRISDMVARRRPRAVQAGARARLGRADRQARRLALQVRQAHARLAQAEDRPRTGVRRSAAGPSRARRAPYFGALLLGVYEARRRSSIYVGHTGTGFNERELARLMKLLEAARDAASARSRTGRRPTNARTGSGPSWSRRSSSPSGPPTASCGIRCTSGCATTRSRTTCGARTGRRRRSTSATRRSDAAKRASRRTAEPRTTTTSERTRTTNDEPRQTPRSSSSSCTRSKKRGATACSSCPTATAEGHQSAQGVLAEAEADQGRPVPLLRRGSRRSSCRPSPIGRW